MKMRLKMKNRSYIYDIKRTRPRRGDKYTKYEKFISIWGRLCVISNT